MEVRGVLVCLSPTGKERMLQTIEGMRSRVENASVQAGNRGALSNLLGVVFNWNSQPKCTLNLRHPFQYWPRHVGCDLYNLSTLPGARRTRGCLICDTSSSNQL